MYIDSHCHLNSIDLSIYDSKVNTVIQAAKQAGVIGMLNVSIDMKKCQDIIDFANFPNVWASVGAHPLEVNNCIPEVEELKQWSQHVKVIAIGETGLDYHYSKDSKSLQQESFIRHLVAGAEEKLPIIVHTRDARKDTIDLIRSHACRESSGVLHCFTESWEMAKSAIDLNYYISFSGIITFKNASDLREIAKKLPLDRILIETDSPYLAPVPFRGKPNQPKYVTWVAKELARIRNDSVENIAEITSHNFFTLFPKSKKTFTPPENT